MINGNYQFKLVKHLYKGLWYKLVESGQEAVNLWLDGSGHPEFCHQLYILSLDIKYYSVYNKHITVSIMQTYGSIVLHIW